MQYCFYRKTLHSLFEIKNCSTRFSLLKSNKKQNIAWSIEKKENKLRMFRGKEEQARRRDFEQKDNNVEYNVYCFTYLYK